MMFFLFFSLNVGNSFKVFGIVDVVVESTTNGFKNKTTLVAIFEKHVQNSRMIKKKEKKSEFHICLSLPKWLFMWLRMKMVCDASQGLFQMQKNQNWKYFLKTCFSMITSHAKKSQDWICFFSRKESTIIVRIYRLFIVKILSFSWEYYNYACNPCFSSSNYLFVKRIFTFFTRFIIIRLLKLKESLHSSQDS